MSEEPYPKCITDFTAWEDLERFRLNGHRPQKKGIELAKIAKDWLPYRSSVARDGYGLGYAPFGTYDLIFCIEMEQERIWNYPEFREGRTFGNNPKEPYRDANPYQERSRARSWDMGYIFGLLERKQRKGGEEDE